MVKIDPQVKKFLEMFYKGPAIQTMNPQTVRRRNALLPKLEIETAALKSIEDKFISIDEDAEIKVRIYTPMGNGPYPLLIYYHGGGWVLGDIELADASCRMIANKTGRIVVSVDYRLAPEYKFPVPLNDCYTALEWVSNNATSINGNAYDIAVCGDSAGGNLATAVSMMSKKQNGPTILAQVLIYPVTSLDFNSESYRQFGKGFGLDTELMIWFSNHYINKEADKKNPYVSPLYARNLENLPPTLLITAENDVLRDEGKAYGERLKRAGVEVELFCEKGLVHGYFTNMGIFPERIEGTVNRISTFLSHVSSLEIKNNK